MLTRAQRLGVLGPGSIDDHLRHAEAYAGAVEAPARALDLGSGAGLPGLVLAVGAWPTTAWTLLDASQRRWALLTEAVDALGLTDRVGVVRGRAEEAGRDPSLREGFDLVVARGFAAPAVTAECAAPFLEVGGRLVVSDPPDPHPGRWPAEGLAVLGLEADGPVPGPVHLSRLRLAHPCPDRYPRRSGIPAKRPLW